MCVYNCRKYSTLGTVTYSYSIKTLISLTGPSTVGKSTLLKNCLSSEALKDKITPILQYSKRPARHDDDERLIKCVSEEEFDSQDFFVLQGNYGFRKEEISNFLKDAIHTVGICANGVNEILRMPKVICLEEHEALHKVVLLRFGRNLEEELINVRARIAKVFPKEEAIRRIVVNRELIYDYFQNDEFVNNYVDEVLYFRSLIRKTSGVADIIKLLDDDSHFSPDILK